MSIQIETIYRNGQILLPPDVALDENTRVIIIVPDASTELCLSDPAFDIPEIAADIGPEDLAQNFDHYLYGHPKHL